MLIIADNSNTGNFISIGKGGTKTFPNFAGMIIVNDARFGHIGLWICSGGKNYKLPISDTDDNLLGTMSHTPGIQGYTWTNSNNFGGPFSFTVIKTKNFA